jgi:two-component system OmpR family response regulator
MPLKCLVVEDEELIALDLASRLEDWGVDSAIAPTVAAALRMHREIQPDLVLLDVKLPDGDGVEVAAKIRAVSDAAIVFVTGLPTTAFSDRVGFLGDFAVVPKPVDYRRLRQEIRAVLVRRRNRA